MCVNIWLINLNWEQNMAKWRNISNFYHVTKLEPTQRSKTRRCFAVLHHFLSEKLQIIERKNTLWKGKHHNVQLSRLYFLQMCLKMWKYVGWWKRQKNKHGWWGMVLWPKSHCFVQLYVGLELYIFLSKPIIVNSYTFLFHYWVLEGTAM